MSKRGIQHLKQNLLATLKNFCEQLCDECRPRHLKHVLKIEGHPLSCDTLFLSIAEHNKQTDEGTWVNLLTAAKIVDNRLLRSLKSSGDVLNSMTVCVKGPSIMETILLYLSKSLNGLRRIPDPKCYVALTRYTTNVFSLRYNRLSLNTLTRHFSTHLQMKRWNDHCNIASCPTTTGPLQKLLYTEWQTKNDDVSYSRDIEPCSCTWCSNNDLSWCDSFNGCCFSFLAGNDCNTPDEWITKRLSFILCHTVLYQHPQCFH